MYELTILPCDYWEKHPEAWCAEAGKDGCEVLTFKKLSDVFLFLGFKLKHDGFGWSGVADGKQYFAARIV